MASIQKTEKGYRVQVKVVVPGRDKPVRDSETFPTRREAVEWGARREAEIKSEATMPLGEQYTLRQALRKYAEEVSPTKRGERWEAVRLAAFEGYQLPLDTQIARITAQHIAIFRDSRRAKVGPASVLRELTLLSSVFQTAKLEWGWVEHNPCRDIRKPPSVRHRERVIQWWEVRALMRAMGYRTHGRVASTGEAVAVCMMMALRTGRHLHKFAINGVRYGEPDPDYPEPNLRGEKRVRLADKRAAKLAAANSFEAVPRAWLAERQPSVSVSTHTHTLGRMQNDVFPWLGKRPIAFDAGRKRVAS